MYLHLCSWLVGIGIYGMDERNAATSPGCDGVPAVKVIVPHHSSYCGYESERQRFVIYLEDGT